MIFVQIIFCESVSQRFAKKLKATQRLEQSAFAELRVSFVNLCEIALNENWRTSMCKKASAEIDLALNTVEGIRYFFKGEIKAQAELRRRGKKVKVEITHAAVFIVMALVGPAEVFCFFLVV